MKKNSISLYFCILEHFVECVQNYYEGKCCAMKKVHTQITKLNVTLMDYIRSQEQPLVTASFKFSLLMFFFLQTNFVFYFVFLKKQ